MRTAAEIPAARRGIHRKLLPLAVVENPKLPAVRLPQAIPEYRRRIRIQAKLRIRQLLHSAPNRPLGARRQAADVLPQQLAVPQALHLADRIAFQQRGPMHGCQGGLHRYRLRTDPAAALHPVDPLVVSQPADRDPAMLPVVEEAL